MGNQNTKPEETQQATDSPKFLTPLAAVQIVWGYTMKFSRDESINPGDFTQKVLTQFCGKAETGRKYRSKARAAHKYEGCVLELKEIEKQYLLRVLTAMECALRSLYILYNGRNYNWKEIEEMHNVYLESLKDIVTFGKSIKEFFRVLPSMALGSAGGITLAEAFHTVPSNKLWLVALLFAALGYFVDFLVGKWSDKRKRRRYLRLDYERTCYYIDYLKKISPVLRHLYDSVKEIYEEFFDPIDQQKAETDKKWIEKMVHQLNPNWCKYIDIHMESNKITPELWPRCETEKIEGCPLA